MAFLRLLQRDTRSLRVVAANTVPQRITTVTPILPAAVSSGKASDGTAGGGAATGGGGGEVMPPGYSPPGTNPPPGGHGYY